MSFKNLRGFHTCTTLVPATASSLKDTEVTEVKLPAGALPVGNGLGSCESTLAYATSHAVTQGDVTKEGGMEERKWFDIPSQHQSSETFAPDDSARRSFSEQLVVEEATDRICRGCW